MDKIPEEAHTTSIHPPSANMRGTLQSTPYKFKIKANRGYSSVN